MSKSWMGLIAALCMVAGCGKAPETGGGAASAKATPAKAGKQIVVGLVSPALTSTFHVTLVRAAEAEGTKLGWKVESLAPDRETNFTAQVNIVESLVTRKVDAISICAINQAAVVGAVERANEAHIPIFVHNSLTDLPGGKVEAYIGYNQRKAGQLCGEYAAELLKKKYGDYKGETYVLLGIPGEHSTERSGGFAEALKKFPGIRIVAMTPANWERQQGMNVAAAAMKAHPNVDLFFGCSDAMDQGAAQAAIEAGKKIFTIGIDGNPDTLDDVQNGTVTATCAVFPDEMGRAAIRAIKNFLDGKKVGPKVETPIKIIDKSNVTELLVKTAK